VLLAYDDGLQQQSDYLFATDDTVNQDAPVV
jgi:hypothetical protein